MRYSNIRTPYGCRYYRSRQEAKYACFFDALGVRFHYEQCKVNLGYCRYVPDFHLLDLGAWVEVKAGNYGPVQLEKVRALAEVTRERTFLFGDPDITRHGHGFVWGDGDELHGGSLFQWAVCPACGRPDIVRVTRPCEFACGCAVSRFIVPDVARITAAFGRAAGLLI